MANVANTEDRSPHRQSSNNDLSKSTALHAVFGFIIGLLLTLVGLKFVGSGTTPFIAHPLTMSLFISASFVYTIAVLAEITIGGAHNSTSNLFRYMYLISGSLACELLGFVIVGPFGLLLMNPTAFLLVELLRRFDLHIQTFKQQIAITAQQQITDTPQEVSTTITEVPQVGEVLLTIQSSECLD
ncbi:hypothetical protein ACLB2K_056886 [Fragaria x ananassa]